MWYPTYECIIHKQLYLWVHWPELLLSLHFPKSVIFGYSFRNLGLYHLLILPFHNYYTCTWGRPTVGRWREMQWGFKQTLEAILFPEVCVSVALAAKVAPFRGPLPPSYA
jgi:hypothetical protein